MVVKWKMIAMAITLLIAGRGEPAMAANAKHQSFSRLPANFMAMKLTEFVRLSQKDFSKITGRKLNWKERVSFFLLKKSMKKSLRSRPGQSVRDFLAGPAGKRKSKTLVIILVLLAVLVLVALIVFSTLDIGSGG